MIHLWKIQSPYYYYDSRSNIIKVYLSLLIFFQMYNYQKYLHDSSVADDIKRIQKQSIASEKHRAQRLHRMINNHEKRIEHSIVQLLQNPIKVDQYKNHPYCPREMNRKKWVVDSDMAFNYEREPIRIIRSVNKNSNLDLIPFTNSSLYQYRQESSTHSLSKSKKSLQNSCCLPNQKQTICMPSKNKINKDRKSCQRSNGYLAPLSSDHLKNYFHSLETIANKQYITNFREVSQLQRVKQIDSQSMFQPTPSEELKQKENSKQIYKAKMQNIKNSKLALQKCGLLPKESVYESIEFKKQSFR